jgi:hypothetical protein
LRPRPYRSRGDEFNVGRMRIGRTCGRDPIVRAEDEFDAGRVRTSRTRGRGVIDRHSDNCASDNPNEG